MGDKTARGRAGKSNAEHSPWRLNGGGVYPLYQRRMLQQYGAGALNGMAKPPPGYGSNFKKDETKE